MPRRPTAQRRTADPQRSTRLIVADGSRAVRAALRRALDSDRYEICADVGDARTAVDAAMRFAPDICLLDVDLRGDAVTAARAIANRLPETAVVMLADSASGAAFFASLRAGAVGYLLKDVDPARLPDVLHRVHEGEAVLPRALAGPLIREYRAHERRMQLAEALTPREHEVLELLRDGLSTAAIAQRLFVAPVTVRAHVASILRKLHAPDREAAVRVLMETETAHPER